MSVRPALGFERTRPLKWPCLAALSLALAIGFPLFAQNPAAPAASPEHVIDLDQRFADMHVEQLPNGELRIDIDGGPQDLTPAQLAEIIHREKQWQEEAGLLFVIFNITTWWGLLWVSVGLLGQLLFTFRMVLQWLASEKKGRSVVPVGFWWGSLLGGIMLLAYFIWRKDAIGILGQSTGAFIYARNLVLIYAGGKKTAESETTPPDAPPAAPVPDTANAHA